MVIVVVMVKKKETKGDKNKFFFKIPYTGDTEFLGVCSSNTDAKEL